jgi:hypothetical protein
MKQIYFKPPKILPLKPKTCGVLTLILLGLGTFNTKAQESLNTHGATISGSDGSVNQSIGQVFNNSISDSNATIYQGIQYAIELKNLNTNSNQFELSIMAYPNPSTKELNLQVSKVNNNNMSYEIYDLRGTLIRTNSISNEKTTINVENLPNDIYLLNVLSFNKTLVKSFKIIKN